MWTTKTGGVLFLWLCFQSIKIFKEIAINAIFTNWEWPKRVKGVKYIQKDAHDDW